MMHYSDCAPRSMKLGVLLGELRRSSQKNSVTAFLKEDISAISEKFSNQGYPDTVIHEAVGRLENGKLKTVDWSLEKAENPSRNFTMRIPYTGHRVSKITQGLRKLIKSFIPNFNLHFAHKTLTVRNTLISHLMPKIEQTNSLNSVYLFTCYCNSQYVGETENMNQRCQDHQQPSKQKAIYTHTSECQLYQT